MCHALVFLSQNAFRSIELDKYFASYSKWLRENKTLLQAAESAACKSFLVLHYLTKWTLDRKILVISSNK